MSRKSRVPPVHPLGASGSSPFIRIEKRRIFLPLNFRRTFERNRVSVDFVDVSEFSTLVTTAPLAAPSASRPAGKALATRGYLGASLAARSSMQEIASQVLRMKIYRAIYAVWSPARTYRLPGLLLYINRYLLLFCSRLKR